MCSFFVQCSKEIIDLFEEVKIMPYGYNVITNIYVIITLYHFGNDREVVSSESLNYISISR